MDAFAARQARRWPGEDRTDDIAEAVWKSTRLHGMNWLTAVEAKVAELHAKYVENKHKPLGINMDDLTDADEPVETYGYH